MQMTPPKRWGRSLAEDIHLASFSRCLRDDSLIKMSLAIRQLHVFSYPKTKHTQGVGRFLFGQLVPCGNLGAVEQRHLY